MKNISLLAIGGILGAMTIRGDANASIVSRGFLDEALGNYATTTALDLKANQSDFTELSNKIGDLNTAIGPILFSNGDGGYRRDTWDFKSIGKQLEIIFYEGYHFVSADTQASILPIGVLTSGYYLTGLDEWFTHEQSLDTVPYIGELSPKYLEEPRVYTIAEGVWLLEDAVSKLLNGWTNSENVARSGLIKINQMIGAIPEGQTVAGMATAAQTRADSAVEKIGTLPTEYTTVGAALTAIKGIAEEAKAAALAAIPDPKAEGSSGKYVLTVDIIGDNATYRWEKIDRSESESITTE